MTFPLRHDQFESDLKAYLDGELPPLRRFAVRRHLSHCPRCREEISAMTQIAEDLRETAAAENAPLSADLREKLLQIEDLQEEAGVPVARAAAPRKRPSLAWGLVGAALLAWFALFPMFQKTRGMRENARRVSSAAPEAVKAPPKFTVRLSDREAGVDSDGAVSVQIKNPDSRYQNNRAQTFDNAGNVQTFTVASPSDDPARQVHKEASLGLQAASPEAVSDKVEEMVKESGGFVAENALNTDEQGLKSAELMVKVPVAQFETFLGRVARLGSLQSKNVTGEDVTEQVSDAGSAENVLENDVQRAEARLKTLGTRAKWNDTEAARELRIQLAQSRARLVLLRRMAALSTVSIEISQPPKAPKAASPAGFLPELKETVKDTAKEALRSVMSSFGALLALLIWLLAYLPLWLGAWLVARYGLRLYRSREGNQEGNQEGHREGNREAGAA